MTFPRTAYITLWFPKPSETFIFREVTTLKAIGLPIKVFTLYGPMKKSLSPEMQSFSSPEHLGSKKILVLMRALIRFFCANPRKALSLVMIGPLNGWRSAEGLAENLWGYICGIFLANRFVEEDIEHIHAPWAGGPATAAWVASLLTGIPFSFAGRAADIYPPEGALPTKIAAAAFVRVNYFRNIRYLQGFAKGKQDKIHLVYNALSITPTTDERIKSGNFHILAVGRFVEKKGFTYLLDACAILKRKRVDFSLTFAGDGALRKKMENRAKELGISDKVHFMGFLSHDKISGLMVQSDVLVMPSVVDQKGDRDGIPNVIMEAYAHGLPVVASDIAGISEVVISGETGILVPPNDPIELSKALITLEADHNLANHLGQKGKKLVLNLFSPYENCSTLLNLFSQNRVPRGYCQPANEKTS